MLSLIRWIAIYPLYSITRPLYNWALDSSPSRWWFIQGVGEGRGGAEKEGRLSCLSRKLSLLKTISFAKLTHRFCWLEFWPYESYSYSFLCSYSLFRAERVLKDFSFVVKKVLQLITFKAFHYLLSIWNLSWWRNAWIMVHCLWYMYTAFLD